MREGYVNAVQRYNIFNATPRLLIETVCMAGLILYLIGMILSGQDVTSMVSQIGAFGVAAMRLLPSANRINNYQTQISYFEPFFMGVSDNLQEEIHDKNMDQPGGIPPQKECGKAAFDGQDRAGRYCIQISQFRCADL